MGESTRPEKESDDETVPTVSSSEPRPKTDAAAESSKRNTGAPPPSVAKKTSTPGTKSGLSAAFASKTPSSPGTPAVNPGAGPAKASTTSSGSMSPKPPAASKIDPPPKSVSAPLPPPPSVAPAPPLPPPLPASAKPKPATAGAPTSEPRASLKPTPSFPPSGATPQAAPPRTGYEFKRSRTYAFALGEDGAPIVVGSGRYARLYLGYEKWEESVTTQQRAVVIKLLQRDLEDDDITRFRQEKALLEHLQGHPSIVELIASGKFEDADIPDVIRLSCEGDFLILEKLDLSLQERLKGSRDARAKEDLIALPIQERLVRVLEYVIPVASAVEYAHIVKNVSHRDINPSNVLIRLADPTLAGSTMQVRLADFSAARMDRHEGVTRIGASVPGTMYFQSPEQETNLVGLLVNVKQGSRDVEYFEDFFVSIAKNDTFALVNRNHEYLIKEVDRAKKRIVLESPFAETTEENVRGNVQKRVGRPADIYAIGALFYYLISGASRNPKALNDTFRKFDEYENPAAENTIEAYLRGEYEALQAARTKADDGAAGVFRYQHFLDANDEPIPFEVMLIIARCMIRNKTDSYCESNDLETKAITDVVRDLVNLHSRFGLAPRVAAPTAVHARGRAATLTRYGGFGRALDAFFGLFRRKR